MSIDYTKMNIDYTKTLSEEFIRENKDIIDLINWYNISKYQKLSENFIREFKNKVDWDNISYYQKLSENFIREFQGKINWKCLLKKYGYNLFEIKINKYQIKSNNYISDCLEFPELVNLTLRLISLKSFQ